MTYFNKSVSRAVCALSACAALSAATANADVFTNVPAGELQNYQLVYQLALPAGNVAYNSNAIPYSVDNSASYPAGSFDRVAYYVELSGSTDATRPNGYVYASFAPPAALSAGNKLGIPSNGPNGSGVSSNATVSNMNVFSNVGSITAGTGLAGGKIEFWPSNYGSGANGAFDHDDDGFGTGSGHGSMRIHNVAVPQTLFGYSDWGGNGPTDPASELGIGTNTGGGQPDWTFSEGGTAYSARTLQVLVHVPEPGSLGLAGLCGVGLLGRRRRA